MGYPGSKVIIGKQRFKGDIGPTWPKCDAGEQELRGIAKVLWSLLVTKKK